MSGRRGPEEVPWIETDAGARFFVHALLVTPAALVILHRVLLGVLGAAGAPPGLLEQLEVVPALARYVAPWVGWLALGPAALCVRDVRVMDRSVARAAVAIFLMVHLATLAFTARLWLA